MVLKEYAQVRNLYKACSMWRLLISLLEPRKMRTYWYLWAALILYFIVALTWFFVRDPIWRVRWIGFLLSALSIALLARDKALIKEYAVEYKKHRIADYPAHNKWFYLCYALFLRGLVEQRYSSEDVSKLATLAEIAGKPEPSFNILQHPLVAFVLVLLSGMFIKGLPQNRVYLRYNPKVWKREAGGVSSRVT
jgi:hypothetical protein